ncbi:MAG: ComF family protein [Anaerolineaceae bacterium]|nr:ComF family protein [Anaerolineaceae bacterium]
MQPGHFFIHHHTDLNPKARRLSGLFASRLWEAGMNLLFPPRCAGCGRVDTGWCTTCQRETEQAATPRHIHPLPPLTDIAATAVHAGKLREAVQALKYENARRLAAQPLGERLVQRLAALDWPVDALIPVPLHTDRLKSRGYNQAQLLGAYVAEHMNLPTLPAALYRQRDTQSQVELSAQERLANVQDAFTADSGAVSGKTLLLIDDVYTTGATLSACAAALLAAGARAAYGLTVTAARDS